MDRYKIQMKAYRKKTRKPKIITPYLPTDRGVYVTDSLRPGGMIEVDVIKTSKKNQRRVIKIIACPECDSRMMWDDHWGAFICTSHGKRAIYELVRPGFNKE